MYVSRPSESEDEFGEHIIGSTTSDLSGICRVLSQSIAIYRCLHLSNFRLVCLILYTKPFRQQP